MAKKTGRPKSRGEGADAPRVINIQVSPEYYDWFSRAAEHLRTTRAGAFDRILAEWAKREGFEVPPARV